jgi:hypothetical protein
MALVQYYRGSTVSDTGTSSSSSSTSALAPVLEA